MNEKTVYACADQEHDAWVCGKCGYIENFEADKRVALLSCLRAGNRDCG